MNTIFQKIKNFIQDFALYLHNKLFSSKYVLKGKCKKCGNCCKNILFSTKDGYIKDKKIFNKMKKKHPYYRNLTVQGIVGNKKDFQNGALVFRCKYLNNNNKCSIYFIRPLFCRDYPNINQDLIYNGVEMLDGCGFYFDVNKKFKDYLNS